MHATYSDMHTNDKVAPDSMVTLPEQELVVQMLGCSFKSVISSTIGSSMLPFLDLSPATPQQNM
jgi:hypothetical protein